VACLAVGIVDWLPPPAHGAAQRLPVPTAPLKTPEARTLLALNLVE
jgi:hypothetical protein